MNTQVNKLLHLPLLVGGIAAILVSSIAIGSLAISGPGSDEVYAPTEPPVAAAARAGAATARARRCAECGVIESILRMEVAGENTGVDASRRSAAGNRGEIGEKQGGSYAITIRLQNGSMRVITDVHSARWRPGEGVTLIGATP